MTERLIVTAIGLLLFAYALLFLLSVRLGFWFEPDEEDDGWERSAT